MLAELRNMFEKPPGCRDLRLVDTLIVAKQAPVTCLHALSFDYEKGFEGQGSPLLLKYLNTKGRGYLSQTARNTSRKEGKVMRIFLKRSHISKNSVGDDCDLELIILIHYLLKTLARFRRACNLGPPPELILSVDLANGCFKTAFMDMVCLDEDIYMEHPEGLLLIQNFQNGYAKLLRKFYTDGSQHDLSNKMLCSSDEEKAYMKKVPYASAVGSIMYAVRCTRPDVAFAQNLVSRYQQNPGKLHWVAVKHILKFSRVACLAGVEKDDTKSQTGYVFVINGGAVDWKSKKQTTIAMHATQSEYMAASEAAMEAVWIRKFVEDLGVMPSISKPINIWAPRGIGKMYVWPHPRFSGIRSEDLLAQLGGDSLMISIIPADVGKPTSRLDKAKVQHGTCYWEKPIYETVKFSQDPKTGRINEKIYYFVVAKDSSRIGSVGEVSIDFASYVEAKKPFSLSLPLKNASSVYVLHVSIQKVQGSFDQSDGSDNASQHDRSLMTYFGNIDLERSISSRRTSIGSDIMLSRSNSNSGFNTPKNAKLTQEFSMTKDRSLQWDWINSTDESSTSTLEGTSEEDSPDAVIQKLKAELKALTRQADVSELELQTLRKRIVKEMKKGQDLLKEVATLKEELKGYQNREEVKVNGMLLIEEGDPWALLAELRRELKHEKNSSSNLRLQLQKSQESNAELVLALEKSKSICHINQPSKVADSRSDDDEEQIQLEMIVKEHIGVKETQVLEHKIAVLYGEIELYKRDKDELEMQMEQIALDYEILKQENHDMSYKLERSQIQDLLNMECECPQLDSLENDLKTKSEELSKSNLVIKELEAHIKNLEEELENQAQSFENDLEELTRARTEQEQRAIRAEDSLRKIRLQNANSATRLQGELKRLSQKMAYTIEVNENAAVKAVNKSKKLNAEKRILEDTLIKVKKDLQHFDDLFQEKLAFLENRLTLKSKQIEMINKEVERMYKIESERSKAIATDRLEDFFSQKEKDLQLEIKELERKLDVLVLKTENGQVIFHTFRLVNRRTKVEVFF
ncbi:EEIG1/EHBP1 N-terminal domain-containing protein [Tanacetum coccineum]